MSILSNSYVDIYIKALKSNTTLQNFTSSP